MKRLMTVVVMLCMVLGMGSMAFAQTGEVSVDQWFTNHALEIGVESASVKVEAPARLTGVKGAFNITDKIGVTGSFVFGKSDDFKLPVDEDIEVGGGHAELSNLGVAVQYQIVPMVKAQAGFFTGGYQIADGDKVKVSGLTIGAAADFEVGNGISIFGEANYAPVVTAKLDESKLEFDDSTMTTFEAGGKYDLGQFQVKAGYRYQGFDFKVKDEGAPDVSMKPSFSGFFVGGGVRF